jgi:excisionase family DNA binding protein
MFSFPFKLATRLHFTFTCFLIFDKISSKTVAQLLPNILFSLPKPLRWPERGRFCYIQLPPATYPNIRQQNMSSNIRLDKTCHFCGVKYIAKTTVTQFCSDNCAKRAYKVRVREQKVQAAIKEENSIRPYNPVVSQKEFLSIKETAQLVGASRWTIYRLIENGKLKAAKLQSRTIIRRSEIDNLFK